MKFLRLEMLQDMTTTRRGKCLYFCIIKWFSIMIHIHKTPKTVTNIMDRSYKVPGEATKLPKFPEDAFLPTKCMFQTMKTPIRVIPRTANSALSLEDKNPLDLGLQSIRTTMKVKPTLVKNEMSNVTRALLTSAKTSTSDTTLPSLNYPKDLKKPKFKRNDSIANLEDIGTLHKRLSNSNFNDDNSKDNLQKMKYKIHFSKKIKAPNVHPTSTSETKILRTRVYEHYKYESAFFPSASVQEEEEEEDEKEQLITDLQSASSFANSSMEQGLEQTHPLVDSILSPKKIPNSLSQSLSQCEISTWESSPARKRQTSIKSRSQSPRTINKSPTKFPEVPKSKKNVKSKTSQFKDLTRISRSRSRPLSAKQKMHRKEAKSPQTKETNPPAPHCMALSVRETVRSLPQELYKKLKSLGLDKELFLNLDTLNMRKETLRRLRAAYNILQTELDDLNIDEEKVLERERQSKIKTPKGQESTKPQTQSNSVHLGSQKPNQTQSKSKKWVPLNEETKMKNLLKTAGPDQSVLTPTFKRPRPNSRKLLIKTPNKPIAKTCKNRSHNDALPEKKPPTPPTLFSNESVDNKLRKEIEQKFSQALLANIMSKNEDDLVYKKKMVDNIISSAEFMHHLEERVANAIKEHKENLALSMD